MALATVEFLIELLATRRMINHAAVVVLRLLRVFWLNEDARL